MHNTNLISNTWRVDPLHRARVIDRFGRTVATAESEEFAGLIATAPDMYEILDSIENDDAMPHGLWEEMQLALRKARGDFSLIFSCCGLPKLRRIWNQDWLKFIDKLWCRPSENGSNDVDYQ